MLALLGMQLQTLGIVSRDAHATEVVKVTAMVSVLIIIIIMYIYHVLINALSAHMIHINLNMIFYTHVEHSPTKTIYIKYYKKQTNKTALQTPTPTHTHINCS